MDLVKILNKSKARVQASQEDLGDDNAYLRGYLDAIDHAIGLATVQAWRIKWKLPIGPETEKA